MKKLYFLPILLFLFQRVQSQSCASLNASCTAFESRCVSTGSIQVTATGGSSNYSFTAVGPVVTQPTSSTLITGLMPGYYSVIVKDLSTQCVRQVDSVYVSGDYSDPRFQLIKTDVSCANNDGTVSVANQQFGRAPFTYTIMAPSPSNIGQSNATGHFSGLSGGEYTIQLQDSCGGIQVRKVTVESYVWWFDTVAVTRIGCDSVNVSITIRDNKNNINDGDADFSGFLYGYVLNGDTVWSNSSTFGVNLGSVKTLPIVVKDPCGQVQVYTWHFPPAIKPNAGAIQVTAMACSTFTASLTAQNIAAPLYCLLNSNGVSLACNNTGVFTGLSYGSYCIEVNDFCYDTVIVRCINVTRPVPSVGATVSITNRQCNSFTAAITGQQNLYGADYCLYDSSGSALGCNTTGVFSNLAYGSYCIKVHDACTDSLITRCFTAAPLLPVLTNYTLNGNNCSDFGVSVGGSNLDHPLYCIYDSLGTVITCDSTGIFTNLPQGNYCVRAISCGDTTNALCFSSSAPQPSVGAVIVTNRQCSTFTATLTGMLNLTNPSICIYNSLDSVIACNATGVFDSLPYGSYCIKVLNTCFDTLIVRCFTGAPLVPSLNSSLQVLTRTCNTVSFQASGTNLSTPQFCLYDASDNLVSCNGTGIFNNQPYGSYCVRVVNSCYDTTMKVCGVFTVPRDITLSTSRPCSIGYTYVDVNFASGSSPFNVKVFHPNGTMVKDTTSTVNPLRLLLPALPGTTSYTVIGTDICGNRDTASIVPLPNLVTTNTTVRGKCPSAAWLNGAGDILATPTSTHYAVIPKIIKKNGLSFQLSYASVNAGVYLFSDLEPAEYIIEYTQQTCNLKIWDTLVVPPYAYPSQGQSALYQCDNNGFSLGADVSGGVQPYTYQIIGSTPAAPSINTSTQTSPVFSINNGTVYSLIRLRGIDACGNATLSDVSVLPMQNIAIRASDSCFFQHIVLTVDTLPNASYTWYKKTTPVDSVLLGSGPGFDLPFFQPEDIGLYVCKMVVNSGCVTRIAYFGLYGCGQEVLPVALRLEGRRVNGGNELKWRETQPGTASSFIVERKMASETSFAPIGEQYTKLDGNYFRLTDPSANGFSAQYRLRAEVGNRIVYSNMVSIKGEAAAWSLYPNPAKDRWTVSHYGTKSIDAEVEVFSISGEKILSKNFRTGTNTSTNFERPANMKPGLYLLVITEKDSGNKQQFRLLLQ